jgi:hypothetical protein
VSNGAMSGGGSNEYYSAIAAEDKKLTAVLAAIRAEQAAGLLTVREAADNRIAALETHIARCQELRREYLEAPPA